MDERTQIPPISELYSFVTDGNSYFTVHSKQQILIEDECHLHHGHVEIPADNYGNSIQSPIEVLSLEPQSFMVANYNSEHVFQNTEEVESNNLSLTQGIYETEIQEIPNLVVDPNSYNETYEFSSVPAPPPYRYSQRLPAAPNDSLPKANRELYYYYAANTFPVHELPPMEYCRTPSPDPSQFFEVSPQLFRLQSSTESAESCLDATKKSTKKQRRRIPTVAQRKAANIRERRRMYNLNGAFDVLRKTVPTFAYEKHLSRIETLKLAIGYICFMKELLQISAIEAHKRYGNAPKEMNVKWSVQL